MPLYPPQLNEACTKGAGGLSRGVGGLDRGTDCVSSNCEAPQSVPLSSPSTSLPVEFKHSVHTRPGTRNPEKKITLELP